MNLHSLVDEITDIVISRLSVAEKASENTAVLNSGKKKTAVVLTSFSENTDLLVGELKKISDLCDFLFFVSTDCCQKRAEFISAELKAKLFLTLPENWKKMVSEFSIVFVPVFDLFLCSKTALLIADDVPSKIVLQSLLENKTIFAGSEEFTLLKSLSARLPKTLLSVFSSHLNSISSMGIKEVSISKISLELRAFLENSGDKAFVRPNNVVTKEDVDLALKEGVKVLELRSGTIVTPLAREYAQSLDLKIIFR